MTREEWLNAMTHRLRAAFAAAGNPLPERVRVSCGWPSSRGLASPISKSRTVGQCWPAECSADGTREVFVSPAIRDTAQVAAVLVHELCHAALPPDAGHKANFRRLALKMGLTGKMTATEASPQLAARLNALAADAAQYGSELGDYPHATLDRSSQARQGTRMVKCECPTCGYTVRTTRKWLAVGLPVCPCGEEMTTSAQEEDPGG